jgi:hypothetical protein
MYGDEEIFPETDVENSEDEASIMADKDETLDGRTDLERGPNRLSRSVEDEPEDFIEGDVDVKTQMDRTERQLRAHLDGGDGDRGRHEDDRMPNP